MTALNNSMNITTKPQTVIIPEVIQLYRCYMPFIERGGLFIPFNQDVTPENITPGQKIFVILTMLKNNKIPIPGVVVWINPTGKFKGYGIQFPDNSASQHLVEAIQEVIKPLQDKKEPTYTF